MLVTLSALLSGCSDDSNLHCVPLERQWVDPAGTHTAYVVNSVYLATSPEEALNVAVNYDGREPTRRENTLGTVLATVFTHLGSDLNGNAEQMIDDGRILHLIDIQTTSEEDATGVGVNLFLGSDSDDDPSDNFSGEESFTIVNPSEGKTLTGEFVEGQLNVGLGEIPLQIALPDTEEPFLLHLTGARIEAQLEGGNLVGSIGGLLSEEQVQGEFMVIVHTAIERSVSLDCQAGECVPDSPGERLLGVFDADDDGFVSLIEVMENELVIALTSPDIDMFDTDGEMNPNCDEVAESLSFAVGFTAVPAQL